jgi:hypothetical protein
MFTCTQTQAERQNVWREFRHRSDLTPEIITQAIGCTAVQHRYLDYYTPDSWPSVFEIVQQGLFCQTGISLVLTATLAHAGFIKTPEVTLEVISNHMNGNTGAILLHSDHFYNFLPGQITPVSQARNQYTQYDRHIIALDNLLR